MRFFILVATVIASVSAIPTSSNVISVGSSDGNVTISKRSGCGSVGPLGNGHYIWYITTSCNHGQQMTCQATDVTGCLPGDKSRIGSMEVDDPNDTTQIVKQTNTDSVQFICPPAGQIRCQANFNDNYDGPYYGLRVF